MSEYSFDQAFKQAFPTTPKVPEGSVQAVGQLGGLKTAPDGSMSLVGPSGTPAPGTHPSTVPVALHAQNQAGGVTAPPTGRRPWDPYGDFNFEVEIDGIVVGAFQKCSGLSYEADVITYRDSMDPYVKYRPGLKRFGRITLTKGYIGSTALWDWCQSVMRGRMERRHGAIHLYEDDGNTPATTYRFLDAWPVRWSGFKMDGHGTGTLVEEIELVTECVIRGGGVMT